MGKNMALNPLMMCGREFSETFRTDTFKNNTKNIGDIKFSYYFMISMSYFVNTSSTGVHKNVIHT